MYDYLVVGAGLVGSIFAFEAKKRGKKCLVIEKRNHFGGNLYCESRNQINIHKYGPHIFFTNNKKIWNYINNFCEFEQYVHRTKVNYKNKIYSFPINLLTLNQLWGVKTPEEAIIKLNEVKIKIQDPSNLKEFILSKAGWDIFSIFYEGYSKKQWGLDCENIPITIGQRIPIRLSFDDNYHDAIYTGMPIDGNYNPIFENLLNGIEVKLNTEFDKKSWSKIAKKLVYCGAIDEFFDYKYGVLNYRSLRFEEKELQLENFQGCSQMNYTEEKIPHTRIIEHKWFTKNKNTSNTIISYEYPEKWEIGKERYYPIENEQNKNLYKKYLECFDKIENVIGGGRMFNYKYMNMDAAIGNGLKLVQEEFHEKI